MSPGEESEIVEMGVANVFKINTVDSKAKKPESGRKHVCNKTRTNLVLARGSSGARVTQ